MSGPLAQVQGLFVGRSASPWPGKPPSAIVKRAAARRLRLGPEGLAGDEQADRAVHGGPDKALHHYPADHYEAWAAETPSLAPRLKPGGFGENLSTTGVRETDLCIGDVLSIGGATVQVSHGRQPCWKLATLLEQPDLAYRVQKSGRTGWYYRVLEPGEIGLGDALSLIDRPRPDWPLARVIAARFTPRLDGETAAALAALPELAQVWREAFAKKRDPAFVEDVGRRLDGPPQA